MLDDADVPGDLHDETDLRRAIEALDRQRIDPVEAQIWMYRGLPLRLLARVGQAWVAGLLVALVAVGPILSLATGSWIYAVVGLVLVIALVVYATDRIESWVIAYNARLDERIRALLARAAHEPA